MPLAGGIDCPEDPRTDRRTAQSRGRSRGAVQRADRLGPEAIGQQAIGGPDKRSQGKVGSPGDEIGHPGPQVVQALAAPAVELPRDDVEPGRRGADGEVCANGVRRLGKARQRKCLTGDGALGLIGGSHCREGIERGGVGPGGEIDHRLSKIEEEAGPRRVDPATGRAAPTGDLPMRDGHLTGQESNLGQHAHREGNRQWFAGGLGGCDEVGAVPPSQVEVPAVHRVLRAGVLLPGQQERAAEPVHALGVYVDLRAGRCPAILHHPRVRVLLRRVELAPRVPARRATAMACPRSTRARTGSDQIAVDPARLSVRARTRSPAGTR